MSTGLSALVFNTYLRPPGVFLLEYAADTQLYMSSATDVLPRCPWHSNISTCEAAVIHTAPEEEDADKKKAVLQELALVQVLTHYSPAAIEADWKVLP